MHATAAEVYQRPVDGGACCVTSLQRTGTFALGDRYLDVYCCRVVPAPCSEYLAARTFFFLFADRPSV